VVIALNPTPHLRVDYCPSIGRRLRSRLGRKAAREMPPGEPAPGMTAWQGVGPAMSAPFGRFARYPTAAGGFDSPINLDPAPPAMQAMAAQQHPQGYAEGGSLADMQAAWHRATGGGLPPRPTPFGMSPSRPHSPAKDHAIA
jgi:hypothetical protein